MFDISPVLGMLITVAIILPYTLYGGLQSVAYTDVVQALLMIVTLILGPILGWIYIHEHPGLFADGIGHALHKASAIDQNVKTSVFGGLKGLAAGAAIATGFSWFFGYLGGQPQLSMRFMAIRDDVQARRARNIGIIWTVVAYLGALSMGWIGIAIFGPGGLSDPELVMPSVILTVFPPVIAAVLITGAIAAMVSTADSLLILSSTEFSENILKLFTKKTMSAKKNLLISRLITACLAVIACVVAYIIYLLKADNIFNLVGYVWAFIGCPYSVVVLLSLFWKKYHGKAAVCTIIGGMLFTIIWIATGLDSILTSRVVTFFASLIFALGFTYALKKPEQKAEESV